MPGSSRLPRCLARGAAVPYSARTLPRRVRRPLIWLIVFAAGFRAALGLSITPPYETYITYEVYIILAFAA